MAEGYKPRAAVIIGVGGMGLAIAKRIGPGRHLILADYSKDLLESASKQLEDDGHTVQCHHVDVADTSSVQRVAAGASSVGHIETIVHTAGLSPVQAPAKRIYDVDLLGTANVIEAFAEILTPGGSMVCISSMAGHSFQTKLSSEDEEHLARAPADKLVSHPILQESGKEASPFYAYGLSKRANHLRVQAAARQYGKRHCRINSISPGIICTPMAKQELASGASGQVMRAMVEDSSIGRYGTSSDIAAAVAFLTGPDASFITGIDLLVDGGSTASSRWPDVKS